MKSILHRVTRADVVHGPFPHVVVEDALDADLYARLMESYPPAEAIVGGRDLENNTNYRMPAARLLKDDRVARVWKDFARYHTSRAFFREVIALFDDLRPFAEMRTSIRGAEPFADVALDCQPVWGSPVTTPSSANRCHVDREVAVFAGLLYCRLPGDDAQGGDLEMYRFRGEERRYDEQRFADESLIEPFRRIPYAANRLVFFLHSPHSLHGVTVRSVTRWPRLHINFLAEMTTKVFDLDPWRDLVRSA